MSFLPSENSKQLSELYFLEPIKGLRLLKFGAILGANASGKTSILRALDCLRLLVCSPLEKKTQQLSFYTPYMFGKDKGEPVEFSIHFIADGFQYRYKIAYNSQCVVKEQLRVLNKHWLVVYSRTTNEQNQTVTITPGAKLNNNKDVFKHLESVTLWNNSVLGGSLKISLDSPRLQSVVNWFASYLFPIIEPATDLYGFVSSLITRGDISKSRLLEYMQGADLMIDDVLFKEDSWESIDESKRMRIIEDHPDMSLDEIKETIPIRHVEFVHSNGKSSVNLQYGKESLGTKRFYQLCGVLDMLLHQRCMFSIDEIDSSIHPDLLEYLLITFLTNSYESQLLITTHHREWLMRDDYMRPDSVWFTEKLSDGSTRLYSLADFPDIKMFDHHFSYYDAYRRGMLGAKPSARNYYHHLEKNEVSK